MRNYTRMINSKSSFSRLIAASLTIGGISLLSPMVASAQFVPLTPAGTEINNTATGTYVDPNNPGTTLNTTSNTVTVTVAEVAGITMVTTGVPVDSTPADPIKAGDTVTYTFTLTNVGNDPSRFRIPNLATITGPGALSGNLQYSVDGGATFTAIIPPATEVITPSVAVGGTVLVRVGVLVQPGAVAGNTITVQLGNTTGSSGSQNVALINNGGDVYTVDNTDPSGIAGEITGVPSNGAREASATQTSIIGTVTKNLALATLLKTRGAYTNIADQALLAGDTVVYDLSLRVENTDVTGQGITPQPLAGFAGINVTGPGTTAGDNYILISDVIPTGTVLAATPTATASGWVPVYSTNDTSTPNTIVSWTTTTPGSQAARDLIKRVGFIRSTGKLISI